MNRLKDHEHMLRSMQYNSYMMRTLMLDLLDLAQLEKNTLTINNEFFDLITVINKSFTVLNHLIV